MRLGVAFLTSRSMRLVRTEVFPVPAPATTSMGPWTCSMASRWRSSGMNKAGRELDFGDAMSGGYHLLELCKQAIGGLRIERGGHSWPASHSHGSP